MEIKVLWTDSALSQLDIIIRLLPFLIADNTRRKSKK